MNHIRKSYVEKLAAMDDNRRNDYTVDQLNSMVMQLPFAEAHLVMSGSKPDQLGVLGEDIDLQQHVRSNFFDLLNDEQRMAFELTAPCLIPKRYIAALEHWSEWRTLQGFLMGYQLEPCVVFRNTIIPRKEAYLADVRILFSSP